MRPPGQRAGPRRPDLHDLVDGRTELGLLAAYAQSAGRVIPVESVLCAAAFDPLASGRCDLHDRLVCEAAAELAPSVGGETSGACVQALGISRLLIGQQIDPGMPWCHTASPHAPDGLHDTLKSGNFGTPDFFRKALRVLEA